MLSKLSDNRWVILAVSFLVVMGLSLPYYGWTPALTSIAGELQLDYSQAGALASVTALAGGIALILGGALVVKAGPKKVILAALVIAFGFVRLLRENAGAGPDIFFWFGRVGLIFAIMGTGPTIINTLD